MTIYGPGQFSQINRLQPVEKDRNEDDNRDERQKRRVLYQGRSWSESEEDLPMQPTLPKEEKKRESKNSRNAYADQVLLERAQRFFDRLTTLEDKIAQLCFYQTEAFYDQEEQHAVELCIQHHQIGGLLFEMGEYKRQSYLIEHYQSISKVPLLIGNDFVHGLSFYFQEPLSQDSFQQMLDERRLSDLGKAVMAQNRRLGVHFQFDSARTSQAVMKKISINESRRKAFRKGIRDAHGIVAKEKKEENREQFVASFSANKTAPSLSLSSLMGPLATVEHVPDAIGVKTLNFLDLTHTENLEEMLVATFNSSSDALICGNNIAHLIECLASCVRRGVIKEEEIEKKVMKILLMKALFFMISKK